jgi:hypothetical protein
MSQVVMGTLSGMGTRGNVGQIFVNMRSKTPGNGQEENPWYANHMSPCPPRETLLWRNCTAGNVVCPAFFPQLFCQAGLELQ